MNRLGVIVLGVLLVAAIGSGPLPPVAGSEADPGVIEYGRECAERIGEVPDFDCRSGVVVPITVDGEVPPRYVPGMTCDRPSLLPYGKGWDGQCVPYSRALVLRDDGELQISAFCRQKLIRPPDATIYDEIDVVLHSVGNGSTCWFQASIDNPGKNPAIGVEGTRVPSPTRVEPSPRFPPPARFWNLPARTASQGCGSCHDSDPFVYSPYIGQTGAYPVNPFGPYANDVGAPFKAWPRPSSLSTRGNTCTGCHRIGSQQTCQVMMLQSVGELPTEGLDAKGKTYPYSHWMPIDNLWTAEQWKVVYAASVAHLRRCCADPGAPGCIVTPIAGAGND